MRELGRRTALAGAALAACFSGVTPTAALTVEEAIAKHVEARGGAERWKAIQSLEVTGKMTSWSKSAPFTLLRARGHRYHLDSTMDGKKVEIGYDGETAWWDNHWYGEGPRRIRGADLAVVMREIDFPSPFFDYRDRGYEVKLLGEKDLEGQKAVAIELKRDDGLLETWYLDPQTWLEIGRESPGSDFGNPMPQRTFYDDFRTVSGVKIPFRIESQWYTRERILNVEKVEANVAIDDARFRMPPPIGMGPVQPMAGDWSVAVSQRQQPSAPWAESTRSSRIDALLGGALLQERYTTTEGTDVLRSITYDKFKKRYRITEINDSSSHLDVQEGDFDAEKRLVVHNVDTKTTSEGFGMTFNSRTTILEVTPDGFRTEEEVSIDGGKEWFLALKCAYTREKKQ